MSASRARKGASGPVVRMPAEWEPHDATWLAWPHERSDWPGKFPTIPWTYAEIVRQLSWEESVEILVQSPAELGRARRVLLRSAVDLERVHFHLCPTDRSWTRDSGPTFVRAGPDGGGPQGRLALVQWKFTAWAKYDNWQRDRKVPEWISRHLGLSLRKAESDSRWVVCEGGAFDVDGSGLLLATEECLLSETQARNPGLGREALESVFREYLGAEEVIWLRRGILGDDTHGHVDDVARFVAPRTVVTVATDDPSDLDFSALSENREVLEAYRSRGGARLEVRELPVPRPVLFGGQRLPASYANFYVANRTVLVPAFDDRRDADAVDVLRRAFPGREVVGIRARDLVWGFGTIHCLTQQQPAARPAPPR